MIQNSENLIGPPKQLISELSYTTPLALGYLITETYESKSNLEDLHWYKISTILFSFNRRLRASFPMAIKDIFESSQVPVRQWFWITLLHFSNSLMNNLSLNLQISVPVYIVLRSGVGLLTPVVLHDCRLEA